MDDLSPEVLTCFARINQSPKDPAAWSDLLYALAVGPSPLDVWATLPLLAQNQQNRVGHLMVLCRRLAESGHHNVLESLSDNGPDATFLSVPRYYAARYAYMVNCDLDQAIVRYGDALICAPSANDFMGLMAEEQKQILALLRRAVLTLVGIHPMDYTDDVTVEADPAIDWPALPPADLLVFAACDEHYFQLYGRQFLESLRCHLPDVAVLIHVMNPTEDGNHLRQSLQQQLSHCGFSTESCPRHFPYYAARRFMLANPLRRHYGMDLLILDIDETLTPQFVTDLAKVRLCELALWRNMWFDSGCSGIREGVVFAQTGSTVADRCFAEAGAWYRKVLAEKEEFWSWDGYGLHYGLAKLGPDRHRVYNLAELWPTLIGGDEILPQVRQEQHSPPSAGPLLELSLRVLCRYFDPQQASQLLQRILEGSS